MYKAGRGLRYISGVPAVIRSRNFPPPRRLRAHDGSKTRNCNHVVSPFLQRSAVTCLRSAQLGAQWSFENSNEMWQGQGCDQNDAVTARSPSILHLHLDEPHDCSFSIHQRCTVHPDGHGGRSRGCGGLHACLHQSRRVVYERGGGGGVYNGVNTELPPPYYAVAFALVLLVVSGIQQLSLGNVFDDEEKSASSSGAVARRMNMRNRSFFKKKVQSIKRSKKFELLMQQDNETI
ncbi:hypothetical protein Naga_100099g5 [Nannochloropsis gaditana]|uniref:Uncharacterized protein n=1 Tax=Nannochloropsis gaditana TaxID=72520 RepID=W7TK97_9STRA|nr:hypothetical protein Naga_100099g5 [Nannochloropsis gaditana]